MFFNQSKNHSCARSFFRIEPRTRVFSPTVLKCETGLIEIMNSRDRKRAENHALAITRYNYVVISQSKVMNRAGERRYHGRRSLFPFDSDGAEQSSRPRRIPALRIPNPTMARQPRAVQTEIIKCTNQTVLLAKAATEININ